MEGHPESLSILIVCEGNVCRSPTAQFVLGARLPGARVESAGLHAATGASFCAVASRVLLDEANRGDGLPGFDEAFRSRRIRDIDLGDFRLVLTATKEQRAALVRANNGLRDRVFTLREAAGLLLELAALDELNGGFDDIVVLMNRFRGALPTRASEPLRLGRVPLDPLDIPDAHQRRGKRHREVVRLAVSAATAIGDSLSSLAIR